MIGSTLSRMSAAEKLSIPQLQQAIQNGTLPAYVGIPILQDKVKQEQQAKAAMAAQQGGQRPTVADQVMQQASAEEAQQPAGIERLPVEAPTMAGGGIIAFADGGNTDYEEYVQDVEDQDEDKRHSKMMQKIMALGEVPEGIDMGYSDVAGGQLAAGQKAGAYKGITGDHKYGDLIRSEAKKVGLDPEYALKIAMIESGGLKNPETARSKAGAIGIMQLMPATAKGLGVDPTIPEENVRGGVSMLKRLVDKYGDYQLAGAAYNAGEGRVDRALRSGNLAGLPGETQGYMGKIRGMKEGGIAHFYGGGETTIDPVTGEPYTPEYEDQGSDLLARLKRATGYGKMLPESERGWSPEPTPTKPTEKPKAAAPAAAAPTTAAPTAAPVVAPKAAAPVREQATPTETKAPKEPSYLDTYMKSMVDREAKRAEQADQDKWLSLMTAGLGMMGGTSPYAAANIGQGAMAGISNYAAMRKQAAAQEAADVKNMLTAQRYKEEGELGQAQLEAQDRYRMAALGGKGTTQQEGLIARLETTYQTRAKQAADNEIDPRKKQSAYDAVYGQIYNDPLFQRASTALYGQPITAPTPASAALPQGVIVRQR